MTESHSRSRLPQEGNEWLLNTPPKSHDEAILDVLEQALKDVCQVLKAHDPDRDWHKDAEVQQALAEKLISLADAGVRDQRELCSWVLQSFDLDAPH